MNNKMEKSQYPKDYFIVNRNMLIYGGLWTPRNPSPLGFYCFKLYQLIVFVYSAIICTFSSFVGAYTHSDNFELMIKSLNLAITLLLASIKIVFWLIRGAKIRSIIKTLESEKFHYEDTPGFNPGLLVREAKATGIRYSMLYFIFAHLTLGMLFVPAFISGFGYLYNNESNVTAFERLPYYTYVPFRHDTPFKYLIALTYQGIPLYMYSFTLIGIDTLMMNIMNIIGVHFSVLQGSFRTIRNRCLPKINGPILCKDDLHNSDELEDMMMVEIKKCVNHFQTIRKVCDELEERYSFIVLGQVLSTLYVLCSSLLLVSTTPLASKEFANEVFYLISMSIQMFLYCWFGNEITLKVSNLPEALWEGDWIENRRPYKIVMLITMIRMNRPLHLTAGKFSPLTLNSFLSIMKGSYSYYTFLRKKASDES